MSSDIFVEGTVKPDGSLELDEKLSLPPGRVRLMVIPLPDLPKDDPFWELMQKIRDRHIASGYVPRSWDEVMADLQRNRDESEQRLQYLEQFRTKVSRPQGESP